jgi:hypothetical protein
MLKVICHECLYEYCEGSIIVLYIVLNCYEFLFEYYEGSSVVLYSTLTTMNGWMSNMKGLLLCYTEC